MNLSEALAQHTAYWCQGVHFCPQDPWKLTWLSSWGELCCLKMFNSSDAIVCFRDWFLDAAAIKLLFLQPSSWVKGGLGLQPGYSWADNHMATHKPNNKHGRRGTKLSTFQFSLTKNYADCCLKGVDRTENSALSYIAFCG